MRSPSLNSLLESAHQTDLRKANSATIPSNAAPRVLLWRPDVVEVPALNLDSVQLWLADLDEESSDPALSRALLSEDERHRADRILDLQERRRWTRSRAILRTLLAKHLGSSPDKIVFSYGQHGKPSMVQQNSRHQLEFNLAHSDRYALLAFSWNQPLGVDIEHIQDIVDTHVIAQNFFSTTESHRIEKYVGEHRSAEFLALWVRKEALAKYLGCGIHENILCHTLEGHTNRVLVDDGPSVIIETIDSIPGYAAAIARPDR